MTDFTTWPDTAHRYFNEHRVDYASTGSSIDLYRRSWQGEQVQVAHIQLVADEAAEDMEIPGDDSDPQSQLRVLQLKLKEHRLPTLLTLLGTPGWKRVFVNEQSDYWAIRLYSGFGSGVPEP